VILLGICFTHCQG